MTTTAKHEIRALLRAHLAAAAGYRHFTRHCPVCHRLLRLAMEPAPPVEPVEPTPAGPSAEEASPARSDGSSTR